MSNGFLTELLESQLEVASLSGEIDAVMRGIVDRLMTIPEADGASLSTVEGELAHFKVTAGKDAPLDGLTLPLAETLGGACLDQGTLVVLRASEGPDVTRCLTPGAGAIILAPVDYDGRTAGILGVRSADEQAFDEHAIEAVRLLARSAAVALRNAEVVTRLSESERRYRDLHDQAADAILVSDEQGRLLDANDAASALLWYPVDALRTMHADALIARRDLDAMPPRHDELRTQRELRGERTFVRQDGTELQLEYSSRVLDDGRVHTTLRDVTERKRAEALLRMSLVRMQEIVATQQEISSLELDPDAVMTTITERAQLLAGADGAAVQWFEGDHSVYRFTSGIAAQFVGLRLDRHASISGAAAQERQAVYSPDTRIDSRVDHTATERVGIRSLICAPLIREDEVYGVLSVMAAEPHAFDELAVETTRLMAEFVGTVIRNSTELDDRRRLVDELRSHNQVVEHMQIGLWIWSLDDDGIFRLEYANDASEQATGLTSSEIVGKTQQEILPAIGPELIELFHKVIEKQELVDLGELEYGDDRIRPSVFTLKAFPLTGNRVAATFENVTAIARSRRALQESESRFRSAFQSASVGMNLTGLDGTYIQVNDRFADLLGYTTAEVMRLGVRGVTHPAEIATDLAYIEQLRAGTIDSFQREKRYLRKDGSVLWAHLSTSIVLDFDGAPAYAVGHVQDISMEREANLLFEATFARSVVPALITRDDRRIVDANEAAAELLGVSPAEAVELTIDALLPDEPVADLWSSFVQDGHMEAEVTLHRPDGGKRQIEFVATANVRPGRHIAVVRDLSRQKELESQLRQAQKMEAVGRLAGGIAHDFNNLLTAISGYSEFLASGIEDPRLRRHAEEIKKAAARAAALTGQLLAFSRRQVLQPRVLDLNAVVSDMDSLLRRLIGEDVDLVILLEPQLGNVRADPTQVEQVIVNLAVNARDAMPHGGSLTIETANVETETGSSVELRLTDTGVGMTDEEREQLFDPFFTTKEGGTGLGLATVYGIVDQSGGLIEVDSAPGMGSSFKVLLPRVEAPATETAPAEARRPPAVGEETILLVEDETIVRQLVAEILETSGYTVLQAGDGPSALELLRRHTSPVKLLVTDVVMPGMSGPEVAQAVTAMRPGTQVLYTSGYTDSAIGHHGVLEPGIAFLQKPFSSDELTRKVRVLLDEAVAIAL
ncbi:MAG: PAS domain S-box protein [Actinobacteria bacterium]|nr:PAS domain S-box protein [Actinomycetota bacterium]